MEVFTRQSLAFSAYNAVLCVRLASDPPVPSLGPGRRRKLRTCALASAIKLVKIIIYIVIKFKNTEFPNAVREANNSIINIKLLNLLSEPPGCIHITAYAQFLSSHL